MKAQAAHGLPRLADLIMIISGYQQKARISNQTEQSQQSESDRCDWWFDLTEARVSVHTKARHAHTGVCAILPHLVLPHPLLDS